MRLIAQTMGGTTARALGRFGMRDRSEFLWQRFPGFPGERGLQAVEADEGESLEHVRQRLDMLTLISRAMWELLEKHAGLEERDLVAKVAEIDLRDGQLDHRREAPIFDCPNCGKKVNARTRMCVFCGFKDFPVDVFDTV